MNLPDGSAVGVPDVIRLLKQFGPSTYQELAQHLKIKDGVSMQAVGFVCAAGEHGGLICQLPDEKYMLVRETSSK